MRLLRLDELLGLSVAVKLVLALVDGEALAVELKRGVRLAEGLALALL